MSKKAVILFSGGQDSTTCLYLAKRKFEEVIALSFYYKQKHETELICAKEIAKQAKVEHHFIKLNELNDLTVNALTRKEIEVKFAENEEDMPNTFVDGRNLLFLSYAAIFAKQRGIKDIYTGVCQADYSGYPDCRLDFITSLNHTLNLAMDYEFNIKTPLMNLKKADIWMLASALGITDIIMHKTLTCYNGIIGKGCGECPSCKLRQKGYVEYVLR